MIAYFNCISGISGDMILGALVDAGVSLKELKKKLSAIPLKGYELKARKVKRAGFRATKVDVDIKVLRGKVQEARRWKDIEKMIKSSKLPERIKQKGLHIFKRLFEAEAKVHGAKIGSVHLHELGATDCIVDILGTLIGLDLLGIETVYSSPLNVGSGSIRTEHGILPVPAPATVEVLKGVPVYSSGISFELTTPTGAVLISSIAKKFGPVPDMIISKTATGAGGRDFSEQANVLQVLIGTESKNRKERSALRENTENEVIVIETNIDDMNPQVYEYVMKKLFKAGALDVFLTQIIMKKGRPGIQLGVLCSVDIRERITEIILRETTTIGVRSYRVERSILPRKIRKVRTEYGDIHVKVARTGDGLRKTSLEYKDCRKIAKKYNIPILEVMNTVKEAKK